MIDVTSLSKWTAKGFPFGADLSRRAGNINLFNLSPAKELEMVNHLPVRHIKAGFALIRDTVLSASTLDYVLYVHVVRVAYRREEVVLDLVGQPAREVIPEPRARGPVHRRLALDRRPVVERDRWRGFLVTAAPGARLECLHASSLHGRVPHHRRRLAHPLPAAAAVAQRPPVVPIVVAVGTLLRILHPVTHALDYVIHDEHGGE